MLAKPLTNLLRKDQFEWSQEATEAFRNLQQALSSAPVLVLPDFSKPFVVETDACSTRIGAVLMQGGQPLAYFSKGLAPRHHSLSIYEKELLAVVQGVEHWHQYLEGRHFVIRTDQQSLKYLLDQKLKTSFQMYWISKLMGYDYEIHYKKGANNNAADALSRMPKMQLFQLTLSTCSEELLLGIKKSWEDDSEIQLLVQRLQQGNGVEGKFSWFDDLLHKGSRLVVGNSPTVKQKILEWLHSSYLGGHSGINATYQRVKTLFWWRHMYDEIKDFIKHCDVCARCKYETVAYLGLLQPLPVPNRVWESISMDFIEGLPKSNGKDTIWVVVDRLSKYGHFVALSHPFSASTLAQQFLDGVYKLHGAPTEIISDRDPIFISNFWQEFLKVLKIDQKLSSSYHPQTDGQTEVLNHCLETYLRCMCWEFPKDWAKWLPLAEWWYNTTYHSATKVTPHELLYGQKPALYSPYLPRSVVVDAVDRSFVAREGALLVAKHHLSRAINMMKQRADSHWSDREFQEGQWVFLKLQPYRQISATSRRNQKLAPRFFGPYRIKQKIGSVAYKLDLPEETRIHDTFHISLLKLCPDPAVKPRHPPLDWPEPPVMKEPDQILQKRIGRRKGRIVTEILVKWKQLLEEETTWVLLYHFQQQFPSFVIADP
ncbi:hypothetical protein QN277_000533 [Acacia crassicarpa]|uniref:Integrase catalytic domain-containing protein n=1 Tax=Acacia crassicarpa TaxID=499986 RepID=A0AAE1N6M8_9FABA|nr:hypothetical protein QN277_000533 [Acacia crassicarpa]